MRRRIALVMWLALLLPVWTSGPVLGVQPMWTVNLTKTCAPSVCEIGYMRIVELRLYADGSGQMNRMGNLYSTPSYAQWDIIGWAVYPGSEGPNTLWFTGGWVTVPSEKDSYQITPLPRDTGIRLEPGQYTTADFLGEGGEPGMVLRVTVKLNTSP